MAKEYTSKFSSNGKLCSYEQTATRSVSEVISPFDINIKFGGLVKISVEIERTVGTVHPLFQTKK